jgi:hypothetical protein
VKSVELGMIVVRERIVGRRMETMKATNVAVAMNDVQERIDGRIHAEKLLFITIRF